MCFFLYLASPLTLSELRAMLPAGLSADLADLNDQSELRALHPAARTVARVLVGACSCDFVLGRVGSREEERELRRRHFAAGKSRDHIISALDTHRRGSGRFESRETARAALMAFVAEHARNAGPTLYLLAFGTGPLDRRSVTAPVRLTVRDLLGSPDDWLVENRPTVIEP